MHDMLLMVAESRFLDTDEQVACSGNNSKCLQQQRS